MYWVSVSIERWCSRLQPRTAKVCRCIFEDFLVWLRDNGGAFGGMGADGLVDWQRHHMGDYALLDVVEDYVRWKQGTWEYKKKVYGSLRSFFAHNRCELPRDPLFKVQGTRAAVRGSLTIDELRRVLASCNTLYRAMFLVMFQGGLGVEELLYWNRTGYAVMVAGVNGRLTQLRLELPGRKKLKNKKPYYSYLGRDAIDALRSWLDERPRAAGKDVFCTQFNQSISYNSMQMYWLKKLSDLAIIEKKHNNDSSNRYGKNLHELRDLFKTRWRLTGQDMELADYFMGHDIDEYGYDKSPMVYPDYFEEGYRNAQPWLNILSGDPEKIPRVEVNRQLRELREVQDAEIRAINLRIDLLGGKRVGA